MSGRESKPQPAEGETKGETRVEAKGETKAEPKADTRAAAEVKKEWIDDDSAESH